MGELRNKDYNEIKNALFKDLLRIDDHYDDVYYLVDNEMGNSYNSDFMVESMDFLDKDGGTIRCFQRYTDLLLFEAVIMLESDDE